MSSLRPRHHGYFATCWRDIGSPEEGDAYMLLMY